ncbi:MAG: S8 family serine peptidase [Lentisphaerae bacterium]|nr:S8 family serine peptidase [Lentisphaerota bacterium]
MFKTHHIPTLLLYRLIAAFVVSLLLWHLPARANDATPQPREASTLPDPVARKEFATRLQQSQRAARAHAISQAKRYNLPITITGDDGYSFFELVDWQNSRPVYYGTLNLNAAISSSANLIWPSPYLAQGANGTVGVWDAGSVRATHQEFDTRVTVKDNVANHTHSTHVAGTIAAKGFNIDAHGMAPLAKIDSYDWLDNYSEIYNAAATNTAALTMVESSVTSGDHTQNWYFHWDRSSPIRATLSWTDPRREAIAEHDSRLPHLVNDLNLKIITPRGKQLLPYVMPFVGNWSLASMSHPATNGINHTDNVEQVYLANPTTAGRYRAVVSVSGTLIHDLQQYSLWISGSKPPPHPPTVIIIR